MLISYFDHKTKQIKWANNLPEGRMRHCTVALNDTTLLVFGGVTDRDKFNFVTDKEAHQRNQ